MLCSKCHKNPATVYYSQTINGQKQEMNLCGECARELNISMPSPAFAMNHFINSFFGQGFLNAAGTSTDTSSSCPSCGLGFNDFAAGGLFGCGDCYDAFAPFLPETLKRIHGSAVHTGKIPSRLRGAQVPAPVTPKKSHLEELRVQLAEAVEREEYERAASLRDEIRAEEKKENGGGGK